MKKQNDKKRRIPRGFIVSAASAAAGLVLFRMVFILAYIPSSSMEPVLKKGSFCIGYRLCAEYETGDVVIFRSREGNAGERLLVKRIKASEGECVLWEGKEYTVPEGCFLMAGDNAGMSYDSRYWQNPYVDAGDLVAAVVLPVT